MAQALSKDLDKSLDLNGGPSESAPPASSSRLLDGMVSQDVPFPMKGDIQTPTDPSQSYVALPPAMASVKQYTADEVLKLMNRTPLFMTTLDETDGEGGDNLELEAIRALAYEGTRAEIAGNFKEQGNDMARVKRWVDAKEFYSKALAALKAPLKPHDSGEGPADMNVVEVDEEAEGKKELLIEEACFVNRALCNLELKNYRSCNMDCASALRINSSNVKAWYRSASACLALDKIPEAEDSCARGLEIDPDNAALRLLHNKVGKRKEHVESLERERRKREERKRAEERALKVALKGRNILTRQSGQPPEMEDATIKLSDPLDASSTLSFPAILLYPLQLQSDFIKAFQETESVGQHLTYIFPLPWDEKKEYTPESVECYMETVSGGLIKAGKKMSLLKILNSGKVEVVDGMLKIDVVPKAKAAEWIEDFKRKRRPT
ncbi:hypothetical protein LTR04_004115 [Oleoguttula sp. CCFEE 6159]|nr:hypothetical protein LTR04_004115 [Oleoguttula sp. CCFEE 6159]